MEPQYRVYKRRWYILALFSTFAFFQSLVWLTFSPIASTAIPFYGFGKHGDSLINLFLAWGCIIFCPVLIFTSWLLTKENGLRYNTVLGSGLMAAGAILRCVSLINPKHSSSILIISLGQILNAAAGPMAMAPVSHLSARWFGESERTIATSVSSLLPSIGSAIGFISGPYIVEHLSMTVFLIIEGVIAGVIFIWILIYFPDMPPTPPSPSAAAERLAIRSRSLLQYFKDVIALFKNVNFMLIALICGCSGGAQGAWTGMFDVIIDKEESQTFIGWLGFANTLSGSSL
eukprot:TRINITY_DN4338_c0_g2_i1.p1 TRINITY_DN4338_c0_g2~~TRINITY_DN4338_c0_g2_i1.p1  ORF type:complete len:288 (-),score=33.69 TRINITY_DN4338_c0_g2_i1:70-933(-)